MKRRLVVILLLLVAGAIVNVAVAWACAMWSKATSFDHRAITDADVRWLSANGETGDFGTPVFPSVGGRQWESVDVSTGIGVTWEHVDLHSPELNASQERVARDYPRLHVAWMDFDAVLFRSGAPARSMSSEAWAHTPEWQRARGGSTERADSSETKGGWPVADDESWRRPRFLSWRPIWPGFAINTVFYAIILWPLFAAPFVLRRRRRIKRGLCPNCAYPVGTNERCTECGVTVKEKSVNEASAKAVT